MDKFPCSRPGWCEEYKRNLLGALWEASQLDTDLGQRVRNALVRTQDYDRSSVKEVNYPSYEKDTPGGLLYHTILALGLSPSSNCLCERRIMLMTRWGWRGCWDNRNVIAGWLAEEAGKIGIVVEPTPQAIFAKGLELVKEKGVEIPASVFEALGQVIDDDPELAKAVQEEIETWQLDLNELFQPKVE
jgi:hypothetical protein